MEGNTGVISFLKNTNSILLPLKDELVRLGHEVHVTSNPANVSRRSKIVIRWGNVEDIPVAGKEKLRRVLSGSNNLLNKASGIKSASHKFNTLQVLKDAGVNVPAFSRTFNNDILPALGRKNYHARANDMQLILQPMDIKYYNILGNTFDYYVKYVPVKREYRVHIFNNNAILFNRKLFQEEQNKYVPFLRNHENGFIFAALEQDDVRSKLEDIGVKAVTALGLNFGAVDVIRDLNDKYYVLEVNTAPGISSAYTSYAQAIDQLVRERQC